MVAIAQPSIRCDTIRHSESARIRHAALAWAAREFAAKTRKRYCGPVGNGSGKASRAARGRHRGSRFRVVTINVPPACVPMCIYRLDQLFTPRSAAVVGASPREDSVGLAVLRTLRAGGFFCSLHFVNPYHPGNSGLLTVPALDVIEPAPHIP